MSESDFLKALGRGEWAPSARRWKREEKPVYDRALRALARARRSLARSRRRRDEALRGLASLEAELRAARAAPPRETPELEKELAAAQDAVANLVQRVALEHRRWKAALLSDRRRLLARRSDVESREERRRKEIEADLVAEREAVANLMGRILQERRRWKASLLSVRRHLLKTLRHPSPKAVKRLASVESELEQSREACANLMVQLSAQKRSGQARLAGMKRRARIRLRLAGD